MKSADSITAEDLNNARGLMHAMEERAGEVAEYWVSKLMPEINLNSQDTISDITFQFGSYEVCVGSYAGRGDYDYSHFNIPYDVLVHKDYKEVIDQMLVEKISAERAKKQQEQRDANERARLNEIEAERQQRAQYEALHALYSKKDNAQ
jgi:hypothetical protein